MVRTVVLDDGTEIELSDDIVSELKTEAVQEFRDENPDVDNIDDLKQARDDAEAKLTEIEEKKDTKGSNMSELRKQKEKAEKDAKAAQDDLSKEIAEVKNLVVNKTKADTMKSLVGDDEEMVKKVEHLYAETLSGMPATTDAEIAERVKAAVRLASPDGKESGMGYNVVSSGTTGNVKKEEKTIDPVFAKKMGLDTDKIKTLKPKVKEMQERRVI